MCGVVLRDACADVTMFQKLCSHNTHTRRVTSKKKDAPDNGSTRTVIPNIPTSGLHMFYIKHTYDTQRPGARQALVFV